MAVSLLFFSNQRGFTLMEVLVAVALVGISIGVILSGFALGHRQALRGALAKEAAQLAEGLLQELSSAERPLEEESGEFEGHPGWRYEIAVEEGLQLTASEKQGEEQDALIIDDDTLEIVKLAILPPANGPKFHLSFLLRKAQ